MQVTLFLKKADELSIHLPINVQFHQKSPFTSKKQQQQQQQKQQQQQPIVYENLKLYK